MNDFLDTEPHLENKEINDCKNNNLSFYNHIGQHQLASKMVNDLLSGDISPGRRCITSTMLLNSKIKISINSLIEIDFENIMKFSLQLTNLLLGK
jgi:hypothetical protein